MSKFTNQQFDIVGSYNNQRFQGVSPERTVNMFEYIDPKAKYPKVLINTSGLVDTEIVFEGVADDAPSRMSFVFDGDLYKVYGNTMYRITASGTAPNLVYSVSIVGTLNSATSRLGWDANTYQIIITDGLTGYIYDAANGLREIIDPGFPTAPVDVTYLDGFFVVANGGTNNFYLSTFNNGVNWSSSITTNASMNSTTNITLTAPSAFDYFALGGIARFASDVGAIKAGINYFVVGRTAPDIIQVSATFDGAPITTGTGNVAVTNNAEIQLGSLTSHPGTIVACRTLHRRLFLFSQNFTEVWENQGLGANLPFRRNNSLLIEYGTPAAGSIATGFDMLMFLSQDAGGLGSVMQISGSQASTVSTSALDYELAQYASNGQIDDADAMLIKENGLIFYRLNFTAANHTYVFNASQSSPQYLMWHEEETLFGDRHPAQTDAYWNGLNYVGAYNQAKLYILNANWPRNGEERIRRMRIGKPFTPPGMVRLRVDRFEVDMLQGSLIGLSVNLIEQTINVEPGDLPLLTESDLDLYLDQSIVEKSLEQKYVYLSISKDSGQSFGTLLKKPMGGVGDRTFKTTWRRLGVTPAGQAFVPKIEFYQDGAFIILGAAWSGEIMPE